MKTYKGDVPKLQPHQSIVAGATSMYRIKLFFKVAANTPGKEYFIPYSVAMAELPGTLTIQELAAMYAQQPEIPPNVLLEESFKDLIEEIKNQ